MDCSTLTDSQLDARERMAMRVLLSSVPSEQSQAWAGRITRAVWDERVLRAALAGERERLIGPAGVAREQAETGGVRAYDMRHPNFVHVVCGGPAIVSELGVWPWVTP